MPVRVGIDLVPVRRVEETIRTHADRYLKRIYTEGELADCQTADGVSPRGLAGRFAAKEATIKVLRPAGEGIPWRSIGVRRDPVGWVGLELSGRAAELAEEAGVQDLALSISHEADMATAVVVAEVARRAEETS